MDSTLGWLGQAKGGYVALAASVLIACICAGLIALRLLSRPDPDQPAFQPLPAPVAVAPRAGPLRISPIIDLPGDPVLVRRGLVSAPKEATLTVPARLGQEAARAPADAYFVASPLVSTTGGYMGKFPEARQEADSLAAQLALNTAPSQSELDAGSDDDGGAETPADAASLALTHANSNQLEVTLGGSRGAPLLKETILKPLVADKIGALLIANGYSEESARMVEAAAAASSRHITTLPPQSVAVAVGDLDLTGAYRVKQLAIFENGEYLITLAWKDDGGYDDAAEPRLPDGLLDESGPSVGAARFTVADGVYSAGIRNGMPEQAIRESIQLMSPLVDLRAPVQSDQTLRVLYARGVRDKARSSGRVVFVGLHGGGLSADCYAFEGADGGFRCFDPNATEPKESKPSTSLGSSGATSTGGILAPIRGAPVTSLFGMRFHPILHILRLHAGIDFGASVGSLVRASADGKVEFAGPAPGFGNHIRIQHGGFETSYSHLSEIPDNIHLGVDVKQGDIIARSGNTGLSTGPHLHFQFYVSGDAVDPLPHLGAEVQSSAPAPAGPVLAAAGGSSGGMGASAAEVAAFPAIKAYIDNAVAELAR